MIYILMGVSGAGKTLIGQKLSHRLQIPFYDGDDFHPPANVKKIASGAPLDDEDRRPWLELLAQKITQWQSEGGAVLACSALKEQYRQVLMAEEQSCLIYLKGSLDLIARRLAGRRDHFMPRQLLQSQFDTLEEPEYGVTISVAHSPEEVITDILRQLKEEELISSR
jgi:carbohydrate kinase (thermoresistant glucokinase family)